MNTPSKPPAIQTPIFSRDIITTPRTIPMTAAKAKYAQ